MAMRTEAGARSFLGLLIVACACACGDDAATSTDSGALDGTRSAGVSPPAPPAPPDFTTCPPGWGTAQVEGVTACDVPSTVDLPPCGPGMAYFPGATTCERVGSVCPAGPFPDDAALPTGRRAAFVQPDAPAGGTGSRASPFQTLAELPAWARSPGALIVLSKGTHEGPFFLPEGVWIRGACAEQTILQSDMAIANEGVIGLRGTDFEIRDLTIGPSARPGIVISGRTFVGNVEDVVIDSASGFGIVIRGAHVTVRNVVVRGTRTFDDIDGTGAAMVVVLGANVELEHFASEANAGMAIGVGQADSQLLARDVLLRNTDGRGLSVETGATADVAGLVVERATEVGVFVGLDGAALTLDGAIVRDMTAAPTGLGRALAVEDGATVTARHVRLERSAEIAIGAVGVGSTRLEDAIVTGVAPPTVAAIPGGLGLVARGGASITVARGIVSRAAVSAIAVQDVATEITLEDVAIRDGGADDPTSQEGRAVVVQTGGTATLARVAIDRMRSVAVFLRGEGASATLTDVSISDTESASATGFSGKAIELQSGAAITGTRVALRSCREGGIVVFGPVSRAAFEELSVEDVRVSACGEAGTCPALSAIGAGAYLEGVLDLRSFLIGDARTCGVQLAGDGMVDLRDGEVRRSTIGACVQVDGYDLARLSTTVRYTDNEASLETTTLPVPSTGSEIVVTD